MECFTTPRHLRQVVALASFTVILLWIIGGQYVDEKGAGLAQHSRVHARRLLATTDLEDDDKAYCDSLELMVDIRGELRKADLSGSDTPCSYIHKLDSNSSKCDFVECADNCQNDDGLIPYLKFLYCEVPSKLIPLAMVFLFLWLIFLFITLGATAEEYFCPALTVMSQVLRLSQNVAGVTLLAFGNGAPDIFSAYAAISQPDDKRSSLAIGALFGAGIFVTSIVVGAVTITKPFNLTQRPFLRDIIFYVFAVFWTFYLLWTNAVTIYSAVGFIAFYLFYVLVVILGRIIYQKWKKIRNSRRLGTGDIPRPPTSPEGREMIDSEKVSTKDEDQRHFSPLPGLGVQVTSDEEEEEEKQKKESKIPKIFRISSLSNSVTSSSGHSSKPIIQVSAEEDNVVEDEKASLLHPNQRGGTLKTRQNELAGASLPPLFLKPDQPKSLLIPDGRRRGGSVGPPTTSYGIVDASPVRPASPATRKKMRRTISGALDVTEEVGAALAIPHVPQIWEEVHRSHTSSRSRSRSRSRSAILEVEEQEEEEKEESEEEEEEDEEEPLIRVKEKKRTHPFVLMLQGIWPFGASFMELGILGKVYEIIKSPASVLLALTVPVVDRNEENHNWNKWLNVVHCVTGPLFVSGVTTIRHYIIGGVFPVWTLILCLATFVAIFVACTSRSDKPPRYHCAFAWLGFAVAVVWIYSVANEIVNLLQAFGIVIKLSDGILGITLLAWGNSIGDAVSNVTMARQGFPRMAIGACFGGPLLNMLLGIGIASTVKTIRRGKSENFQFPLQFHQVEFLASIFLMVSLCSSLVVISCLGFKLKRVYGGFLICFYIVFLILAVIAEFDLFTIPISGVITHDN